MKNKQCNNPIIRFFRDLYRYFDFTFYSVLASLKSDISDSRLGVFWFVLEPLLGMAVYFYIFSFFFHKSQQYIGAYIFIGISIWRFIQSSLLSAVTIIKKNKGIISKTYLPKFILVLSKMLENLFRLGISLLISISLLVFYRVPFTWNMFLIVPIIVAWCPLLFGLSCIFSHLGVYVSDLEKLLRPTLRAVFYFSGTFYSLKTILGDVRGARVIMWNPVAALLENVRNVYLYGEGCSWNSVLLWFAVGIILSIIGVSVIYKKENEYVKVI